MICAVDIAVPQELLEESNAIQNEINYFQINIS
jgi:hypothetical protein